MYTCPMHPEVTSNQPGLCPRCHMKLVKSSDAKTGNYTALAIIILVILGSASAASLAYDYSWTGFMTNFMAGFFLVFSLFKVIDLPGFASSYTSYDLLARKWPGYGYIYPFIELSLGLAYLTRWQLELVNPITAAVMFFGALGIIESLRHKRKFQCACLGTVIKLPLSTVTLVEDLGMAAMALAMMVV